MISFFITGTGTKSQGHNVPALSSTIKTPTTRQSESHSYFIPVLSGVLDVTADKFLNNGRTSKFQLAKKLQMYYNEQYV